MHQTHTHISSKPRLSLPRLLSFGDHFTAEEVRQRLRPDAWDGDSRTAAVHAAAARTAVWSCHLTDRAAFDLGRSATRLPTVVFWHCQGLSADEIGRRLSPFGTSWDADRALDAAARLIAKSLNSGEQTQVA